MGLRAIRDHDATHIPRTKVQVPNIITANIAAVATACPEGRVVTGGSDRHTRCLAQKGPVTKKGVCGTIEGRREGEESAPLPL